MSATVNAEEAGLKKVSNDETPDPAEHLLPIVSYFDTQTNVYWPNLKRCSYGEEIFDAMAIAVDEGSVTRFAELVSHFARAVKTAAEHHLLPPAGQTEPEFSKVLHAKCNSLADVFDSVSVLEDLRLTKNAALAPVASAQVDMVEAIDAFQNAKAPLKLAAR